MPTTRPATTGDAQLVTDLLIAVDVQELGEPDWTYDDTEEKWRSPLVDLGRDTRLVLDGDRALAYAYVTPRVPGEDYDADTFVLGGDPAVEDELIAFVETRARETALPGATIHVAVHAPNTGRAERFRRAGYEYVRTFWRMRIELDAPVPEPAVPAGLELRTFRDGDARALFETGEEAFATHFRHAPQTYEQWRERLLARADFDPGLVFVVTDGEQMAAALTGVAFGEETGWIRMLGVRPAWRGRGLGKALLYAAFGEFRRRGFRDAALGVDAENETGATRLYEGAGMSVQRRFDFYRLSLDA